MGRSASTPQGGSSTGVRNPVTPPVVPKRINDTWSQQGWGNGWDNWKGTQSWDSHHRDDEGWGQQTWWNRSHESGSSYQGNSVAAVIPPWTDWGGVTGNVWPWGEQLYRVSSYTWTLRNECPKENVTRLKKELGCFLVEAWHAYLAHWNYPSKDPKICTTECCRGFLDLIERHDCDVRIALKEARIRVNWPKAARYLNQATNPGTWGQRHDKRW